MSGAFADAEKDEKAMERPPETSHHWELTPQLVTILTTEHFTLQSAQAQEIEDINGRTALYVGAISGTLIALAFIGQLSQVGTAFAVFSLVLFPSLIFMGVVTFERTMQSTYAVITYARGISRLRHLYLEYAPQLEPYFILSSHDEMASITGSLGITSSWWQLFLIAPGMIAVINSVLVGTFVGLLLSYVCRWSFSICVGVGVIAFLINLGIQQWRHWRYRTRTELNIPTRFPHEARR